MSFNDFKEGVLNTFRECEVAYIKFMNDVENGRYIAKCNDDLLIVGNHSGLSVKILWNGRQHQAFAKLIDGKFIGR